MSLIAAQQALDSSAIPSSSSSDLIVVPATPLEHEQTWQLNAAEWMGPLTFEQYLERERVLIKQDLTKDNGITAWILTSNKLPLNLDGTRPILSACETLLKTAYVARNGNIERIRAHGIGSVFTRSEYRGKGYAGRMMKELGKRLGTHQQLNGDTGSFSVLFSDIGQLFYARYGWKAFASTHIELRPLDDQHYKQTAERFPIVQDLTRNNLTQIPAADYLEQTLTSTSRQSPKVPCVAIRPDMQHFDWHHAREEVQSRFLGLPEPTVKGAIHQATGIAMIWSRVFASNPKEWSLYVLHIAVPPALQEQPTAEVRDALSALLLRAQIEAHTWKMAAGVQVWDPSPLVISAAQSLRSEEQGKVEVIKRDKDHICSLRWIGGRPEDEASQDVKWVNIEKYAWC